MSEADILLRLGDLYWEAALLDKSGEYYRQALLLEPGSPDKLTGLPGSLLKMAGTLRKV